MWARAEVIWEDPGGAASRVSAIIEDKSPSGVRIRLKSAIPVGTSLTVVWARDQFSGIARNCRNDGHEFVVGIERDLTHRAEPAPKDAPATASVPPQGADPLSKPNVLSEPPSSRFEAKPEPGVAPGPETKTAAQAEAKTGPKAERRPEPSSGPSAATAHSQPTQPASSSGHERNAMQPKGFFSKFQRHEQDQSGAASHSQHPEAPVNSKAETSAPTRSNDPQSDFLSCEDIYHASGIMPPHTKYDITKVAEMLNSKHLRELAKDAKRASVLMALDAAGTHVEEVLQDATRRLHALDTYETGQQKQLEEFEARKVRENAQIQAELERLTAHYAIRIKRNQDQVAHEKTAFRHWQTMKEQESKRIADAVGQCGKQLLPEAPADAHSPAPRAAAASMSFQS